MSNLHQSDIEGSAWSASLLEELDRRPEGDLTAHFKVEYVLTVNAYQYDYWVTAENGWSSLKHSRHSGKREAKALKEAEKAARKLLNEVRVYQGAGPAKTFTVRAGGE